MTSDGSREHPIHSRFPKCRQQRGLMPQDRADVGNNHYYRGGGQNLGSWRRWRRAGRSDRRGLLRRSAAAAAETISIARSVPEADQKIWEVEGPTSLFSQTA